MGCWQTMPPRMGVALRRNREEVFGFQYSFVIRARFYMNPRLNSLSVVAL